MHPVILDTFFQVAGAAAHHGFTHAYKQAVPSSVEYLVLSRCSSETFTLSADVDTDTGALVGNGCGFMGSDSTPCLEVSGVRFASLDPMGAPEKDVTPWTARCTWVPCIDFIDFHALMKPGRDHAAYFSALNQLGDLAIALYQRTLLSAGQTAGSRRSIQPQKYIAWVQHQPVSGEAFDDTTLVSRIDTLSSSLMKGPSASVAAAIARLCEKTTPIVFGEIGVLEVLHNNSLLGKFSQFLNDSDISGFLNCLSRGKPNLRILEIGTELGPSIGNFDAIRQPDGEQIYSTYVYTEKSADTLKRAEDYFQMTDRIEFVRLDISEDPAEQGFQNQEFDLVIARGAIHATRSLQQSLKHVRRLLRSDGYFLLQQPRPGLAWVKFVLGAVPGWWCGSEDGRGDEPYVYTERWDAELRAAGFGGVASMATDAPEPFNLSTIMLARPRKEICDARKVTLLHHHDGLTNDPDVARFKEVLEADGWLVTCATMDSAPRDQDMVAFLESERPFLGSLNKAAFEEFKDFLEGVSSSKVSILWLTKPTQINCHDPDYAPIIGLARTLRLEMGLEMATCETDDLHSSTGLGAVACVLRRFQDREQHTVTDFEYSITGGRNPCQPCFSILTQK
ncbi:hypothetical protein PG994_005082 [Apiospora phragmitis]|uniref:Polyketide synthase n=1 Tax=Apiospora phragmitis TaxID=2905665 RepID=A0ABR1VSG2_9PEZI